ncbi:DNase I-like protein [Dioscorea alata]|uniref:DNase I-like protein n=1 Tax=Dioscorea alata TaxID=55571 RepID=A0ACB7W8M4_DIOAL|nr:DNase I-like protein [Dioscorea alata]
MKILSWNVRGLGRPSKCHLVKDFIFSCGADIVYLQESKLHDLHSSTWRLIGGSRLNTFEFLPALDTAGGIIIAWDHSQVIGTQIHKGTFSITIEFTNQANNSIWACTSVYRHNTRPLKVDFWNELRIIRNLHSVQFPG